MQVRVLIFSNNLILSEERKIGILLDIVGFMIKILNCVFCYSAGVVFCMIYFVSVNQGLEMLHFGIELEICILACTIFISGEDSIDLSCIIHQWKM